MAACHLRLKNMTVMVAMVTLVLVASHIYSVILVHIMSPVCTTAFYYVNATVEVQEVSCVFVSPVRVP